jgi:hypothetical protein
VIFPPATVSWTWTGPQRVCATLPVTVVVPAELALDELGAADDDVPVEVTGASAEAFPPAVAAALDEVDVW